MSVRIRKNKIIISNFESTNEEIVDYFRKIGEASALEKLLLMGIHSHKTYKEIIKQSEQIARSTISIRVACDKQIKK